MDMLLWSGIPDPPHRPGDPDPVHLHPLREPPAGIQPGPVRGSFRLSAMIACRDRNITGSIRIRQLAARGPECDAW